MQSKSRIVLRASSFLADTGYLLADTGYWKAAIITTAEMTATSPPPIPAIAYTVGQWTADAGTN